MRIYKKFLIMLLLTVPAFANNKADVLVSLDLNNINNIEIGFSENAVTSSYSSVNKLNELDLEVGDMYVADNSNKPLYAYWKVMSSNGLSISIYGSGKMLSIASPENDEEISWNIGLLNNSDTFAAMHDASIVRSYDQSQTLYIHSPHSGVGSSGSKQIGIVTDPLDNTAAGEYTADLVLDIKIE